MEETPLQKATRLAKEQSSAVNKSSATPYKEMSYEDYLAQKNASKKKASTTSTSASKSGSKTSTAPSLPSQKNNETPFDINFDNAQSQEEFIGKENTERIRNEVETSQSQPLSLDITKADTSKIPYSGINDNEINRLTPEQVVAEEAKRRNASESSYGNLLGNFIAEAGKTITTDVGNISKAVANNIASNRNDFSKLGTADKLKIVEEQQNPFTRIRNLFSALTETIDFNPEEGLVGNYAKSLSNVLPEVRNAIAPGNVYQQWDNMISSMSDEKKKAAIENLISIKNSTDQASANIADWQSNNPVPKNIFTSTVKAIGQMAPDIAMMMLTEGGSSEITAAKYANMFASKNMPNVVAKYAPKAAAFIERGLKSSATKVFAAKGAFEAGANNESVLEGTAKGALTGVYMHSLGELAGYISKPLAKSLSKTGLPSEYSTLFSVPTANATTFAGAKALTTPITEGRLATKDELYEEMGIGIGMSALGLRNTFEKHSDMNKLAKDVLVTDPIVGLKDVLRMSNEKILDTFDPQMDVKSLTKARDEIKKSIITEPDVTVKQELMAEATKIQQKLDSRIAIEELLTNKDAVKETFKKTEFLSSEQKQRINDRIENINETFVKAENEAKAQAAGEKIERSIEKTEVLADELVNAETPEQVTEIRKSAIENNQDLATSQQELHNINTPPKKYEVGEEVSFGDNQKGVLKKLLPDNKAIIGINTDGIYSEQTIDLPKQKLDEKTIADTQLQTTEKLDSQVGETAKPDTETSEATLQVETGTSRSPIDNSIDPEFEGKTPDDLAGLYNEEVNNPSLSSIELAISKMPFSTNRDSYTQFGDRNNITSSKARSYFKKDALSLDQIAQEINNTHFDGNEVVEPQDLIDFIDRFPNGPSTVTQPSGNPRLRAINEAYFAQTGKRLNQKSAADIVSKQEEVIQNLHIESFNQIDENSIRIIEEEGVTLENIQSLENAIKFIYGDQAYDDLLAHLIFGPLSKNNDTGRQTAENITNPTESSGADSRSSELEGQYDAGGTRRAEPENGWLDAGGTNTGGTIIEEAPSTDIEFNENVQPGTGKSTDTGENNSIQSAANERTSDSEAKIALAKENVANKTKEVARLQNEVNDLSSSLEKNLKENQQDIFGQNQTQSLFDDRANQHKIYEEKVSDLLKAQQELAKSKQDLKVLQETEGQLDLNLPPSNVDVNGENVDLSKTDEDTDSQIITKSFINPFRIVSDLQKAVDKLENKFTERVSSKIADALAESLKTWRTSKSTLKQVSSSYLTSVIGGIARTNTDANAKLGLIGGKNLAVYNMPKIMKTAYEIVDNNTESLERVHVVLDPEFYQEGLGGQSNAFKANVPPDLQYDDLTDKEKLLYDHLRKMLDDIHFKNYTLGFISKDVFDKHKGTYVPRMYETFELPAEIKEVLDTYHGQVGDKLNLNPFKKRKDLENLSDESKNAILKDPVYAAAKRQMELDTNSAIMTYINHINRNNKSLVHTGEANIPFNYEKLEGKAYGALDGKYVPSYLAEDLRGYFFVNKGLNNIYDTIKAYDRTWARKGIKKGLTVYNPFVQIGNFTSNIVFAQMAGIDFVRWFGNTPNAIKQLKEKGTDYEELVGAGLIGTDIVSSELIPNTERANSLLQQAEAKKSQGPFSKLLSGLKAADNKLLSLYSGNDDYAKINAYQILKSQGYSKEEAIKKVYDGFQNYATVGKFWDVASKTPVFGNPFQKFSADLMRITGNAVTKKPLSTSIYLAALYYMPGLILSAIGWDEDETELEKELRESRPFIPKMDLGAVNIPLVYKTKYGELNLARYITPYFYFDNGEDGALSSMTERFSPVKTIATQGYGKGNERDVLFGQDPILGTLYNSLITDTDFRGKSVSDPDATRFRASGITDEEKWQNIFTNAARTWVPNGGLLHDTYLNAKYGEDYYGRSRNMTQALVNFAVKIQSFKDGDYKKTAEKQLYSLANSLKGTAETIKNAMVLNQRQRQKAERDYRDGKKTLPEYQSSLEKLDSSLKSRIEELNKQMDSNKKEFTDFKNKYNSILDR